MRGKTLGDANFGDTTIKKWIENLGSEDLMKEFDKTIDGSVGGLGSTMEKVLGTDRYVPLFEFRELMNQQTSTIPAFVKDVDEKLVGLHKKYKEAPKKGK